MSARRRRSGVFGILDTAREYRAGGPGPKATLMVLLEHIGEVDGEWVTYPSMALLAHESEQSEVTVRRHLRDFERTGLLVRRSRGKTGGGRTTNLIVLNLEMLEGEQTDHCDHVAIGQTDHPGGGKPITHEESHLLLEEPVEVTLVAEPSFGFDDFWNVYPRRAEKAPARKAWSLALRRASAKVILAGAQRYRDDPNRDPAYTAHPATWLNRDRWEDDPLPPRSGVVTPNGKSEPQSWSMAYTQ